MNNSVRIAAAAVSLSLLSPVVLAKELTLGNYLPPSHYSNSYGLEPLVKEIAKASGGELQFKLFPGGQLYNARRSLSGIGNRISDAGLVIPLFSRSELRHAIIVTDMVFATANPLVSAAASTETILMHCPECQEDYKKQGAVFLAGYSTMSYNVMCKPDVRTLAAIKGKKMRAVGAQGHLAKQMGGVPVSMPMSEAVEAMQRGAVDCIVGPLSWLVGYPGTDEVVNTIIQYPFGISSGLGMFVMNKQAWNGLSTREKQAIVQSLPGAISKLMLIGTYGNEERARKVAAKRGIKMIKGSKEFADLMARFTVEERNVILKRAKGLGIKDPDKIANAYQKTVAKWEKIMERIGEDEAAYAKALRDEIYSKLDLEKL